MPLRKEAVETLVAAGLTILQAKVYFALVRVGKADVKTISQSASLDRSNTYKTMDSLKKFGLVEEIVGTPHSYVAIPMEFGLSMLLKKRTQELARSKKKADEFLKKFSIVYQQQPEEEYFTILPGREAFIKKWESTLKTVTHSVNVIATEKREPEDAPVWEIYRDSLLPKGVRVRWILDRSRKDNREFLLRVKEFEDLFEYSNLSVRTSADSAKPYGITCDDKFAVFFLDPTSCVKHSRTLWTNNPTMIMAFQDHFEAKWRTSEEYKPSIGKLLLEKEASVTA
ncbi:MAG: TrmB family transcriptional regulator [Candidatus Bathyarchaeia archaeon]